MNRVDLANGHRPASGSPVFAELCGGEPTARRRNGVFRAARPPKLSRSSAKDDRSGFALVIALALMAFVLLLLLSMTTLLKVETRSAALQKQSLKARQNALLGLYQALGELQRTAGPDQRVTARADLRAPLDGTSGASIEFKPVANPLYTLVWDVSGAENQVPGSVPGHNPDLLPSVLVSGNSGLGHDFTSDDGAYPGSYVTGTTTLNPADPGVVTLRGRGLDPDRRVLAPRVSVDGGAGHFAWWTGDENVKARLNLNRPVATDHPDAAWLAPQRFGVQAASFGGEAYFDSIAPEALAPLLSLGQLPLAVDALRTRPDDLAAVADAYTAWSESLLTDVRNGGLKKDLTYGLDADNPQPAEIADAAFLFSRTLGGAPDISPNMNFAQWGVLRDYYNLRTDGQPVEARAHRVPDSNGDESYTMGIHPVIARFQLGVYANYVGDNIRFRYMPAVVLWNPYSVDIKFPELHLIFKEDRGDNRIRITGITVEGDPAVQNKTFTVSSMPFTISPDTIPAGKAVIYSAEGVEPYSRDRMNPSSGNSGGYGNYANRNNPNELKPGFRQGDGFEQLARDSNGDLIEKSVAGNPRLRFAMQFNGRMYIDLHERNPLGGIRDKSREDFYQLVTGMDADANLGSGTVQFYQPLNAGFPDPKFLFSYTMPFAGTDFFTTSMPPRQWAGLFNPRAKVNTVDAIGFGYEGLGNYVGGFLAGFKAEENYPIQTLDGTHALVGTSATFGGSDRAVLFDLPEAPPHSLGQLAHANLLPPPAWTEAFAQGITDQEGRWADETFLALRLSFTGAGNDFAPAYAIGSGRANPYLPLKPGSGSRFWRGFDLNSHADGKIVWDFPYLLNEVLFDRYFFSTVPQSGPLEEPFRNPLIRPADPGAPDPAKLRDFEASAGELVVEGGFNVNSTSVQAWTAFLAGLRDADYAGQSGDGSLFPRFMRPTGNELDDGSLGAYEPDSVTGFRRLNDARIRDLAERIVEQVKLRGPFPSLAAFVNRVMWEDALVRDGSELSGGAPDPANVYDGAYDFEQMVMRKSALEAALDLSAANEPFHESGQIIDGSSDLEGPSAETRGFRGAIGTAIPGYLSQVDLLSFLAPLMTVRSDTFIIRSYGSTVNPVTGDKVEAWLEAVVRRTPEYINAGENDKADRGNALTPVNETFGRRFEIINMRWLNPDEV